MRRTPPNDFRRHRHRPVPCAHCGTKLDAASHPTDPTAVARPGTRTFCLCCNKLSVFQANMTLRAATPSEVAEVMLTDEGSILERAIAETHAAIGPPPLRPFKGESR